MTNHRDSVLYTWYANDLVDRVGEDRSGPDSGIHRSIPLSQTSLLRALHNVLDAITREKQIKKWRRKWKLELLERDNPGWRDLYEDMTR